jgi:hypothetical protein
MTVSGCYPFILRFSKSMHRQNPRKIRGGTPRTSCRGLPDRNRIVTSLDSGFKFYKGFEYNSQLPVFSSLNIRADSLSKSLRYHFLASTGIRPVAGISLSDFIFSIENSDTLSKLKRQLLYGYGHNFLASFSHVENMKAFMPENKIELSNPFGSGLSDIGMNEEIHIHTLPGGETEQLVRFLKNETAATSVKVEETNGYRVVLAQIPDVKAKLDRIFTHSLVRSVSPASCLLLKEQYVRHDNLPLECVRIRDSERSYPRAAIVDSGVASDSFLKEWEMDTASFCPESERNPKHGTFVTGRLLTDGEEFGGIIYLNAEILPAGGSIELFEFQRRMERLLKDYHKIVRIYNISLGSDEEINPDAFSAAAHVLDTLQERYDVLFIISGGNYQPLREVYNLPSAGDRVTAPAESLHSLTVGSVTHKETNVQPIHTPSLFSRRGPSVSGYVKPDVCAYGGAHEKRMGRLYPSGVFSIGTRNELAEDSGTSHAAPRVASLAAKIYHRYSHVFQSPDMTKAIILHYTRLRTGGAPDIFTGYGIVPDSYDGFEDLPNSAVYLHEGSVRHGGITEVGAIPVPAGMKGRSKQVGSIEITLVYKTKTDMNFPNYYCCTNLELSLGFYRNGMWKALITSKNLLSLSGEKSRQSEAAKWNPVKLYETRLKGAFLPPELVLRITPSKRDFFTENIETKYAIVLSFTHESRNLFQDIKSHYAEYDGLLEPVLKMWKNC